MNQELAVEEIRTERRLAALKLPEKHQTLNDEGLSPSDLSIRRLRKSDSFKDTPTRKLEQGDLSKRRGLKRVQTKSFDTEIVIKFDTYAMTPLNLNSR